MGKYTATFHTHLSAMMSYKNLKNAGVDAKMAPVPRSLSSSCGTCVKYEGSSPRAELMDKDMERIYSETEGVGYIPVTEGG